MDLKQAVEDYLPSKLSKALLGISIFLAGTPFLLPETVIAEINFQPKAQLLFLKLLISLSLLLIGAFAILIIEIRGRLKEAAEKAKAPTREYDEETGTWIDKATRHRHCAKCEKPLQVVEAGWYCVLCHYTYQSLEFRANKKAKRLAEDERIRQHNKRNWLS